MYNSLTNRILTNNKNKPIKKDFYFFKSPFMSLLILSFKSLNLFKSIPGKAKYNLCCNILLLFIIVSLTKREKSSVESFLKLIPLIVFLNLLATLNDIIISTKNKTKQITLIIIKKVSFNLLKNKSKLGCTKYITKTPAIPNNKELKPHILPFKLNLLLL